MPLVSIIIPVYNTEKYLRTCLDSIVKQTYSNIEIIIIEDNSPDHVNSILCEYEKEFKNIKVIHNPINLGIATTRNIGLEEANGDFILFVDSDDFIDITTVENMVDLVKKYSINLIQFGYTNMLGPIQLKRKQPNNQLLIEDIESNHNLLLGKTGHCWCNFYSHSLIDHLRFPDGVIYEDNAFTYPAFSKAGKMLRTQNIYYYYRRNINSITLRMKMKPTEKILDVYKATDYIKYNCQKLNTYNTYCDIIDQIMVASSLIPALTATTWLQMKRQDQKQLVQLLYQYSRKRYHFHNLDDIPFIYNRRQEDKLYDLRIQYLLKLIEGSETVVENDVDSFEKAKQIIKKY